MSPLAIVRVPSTTSQRAPRSPGQSGRESNSWPSTYSPLNPKRSVHKNKREQNSFKAQHSLGPTSETLTVSSFCDGSLPARYPTGQVIKQQVLSQPVSIRSAGLASAWGACLLGHWFEASPGRTTHLGRTCQGHCIGVLDATEAVFSLATSSLTIAPPPRENTTEPPHVGLILT